MSQSASTRKIKAEPATEAFQGNVQREAMIESQLMPNRVIEPRLLEAIRAVPREMFVPLPLQHNAYIDEDIPLPHGRFLMDPVVFGRMLAAAEITPESHVLDVGCGTGYSTAVLAHLAQQVVGLEEVAELAHHAQHSLARLQLPGEIAVGALVQGYAPAAPYDVILINGATQQEPTLLLDQLADGGRLLCVRLRADSMPGTAGVGSAVIYRKVAGKVGMQAIFDASTPLLPVFALREAFKF